MKKEIRQYRIDYSVDSMTGIDFEMATCPNTAKEQFLKRRPAANVDAVTLEVRRTIDGKEI